MTTEEAIAHLNARKRLMDDRYVDQWPKWTVADHVALSIILVEVNTLRLNAKEQNNP